MLCQFTIKNFKSIREETTFDMEAAAITEHDDRIIRAEDGSSFLPVSVIYGPNGGGKSNVLEGLYRLKSKVLRPIFAAGGENEEINTTSNHSIIPFAFSETTKDAPTEFELFFRTDLAEYRYALWVKKEIIIKESLDRIKLDTKRKSSLFNRTQNGIELRGAFSKLKISDELSETLPLLSYLGITYKKNIVVEDVLDWFRHGITILNYGNPLQEMRVAIANSGKVKDLVLKMIQEMDLDITDFRIERKENDQLELYTKHVVDGCVAELSLSEESSGTGKLFGLLPYFARSILHGKTLVIDELDAKLHPVLLRHIIMMYNDMNVNRYGAQLIFTSHDLSTMNNEVFRRDEIWFVAKGNGQNSKLYSLVEFKGEDGVSVRKDARFDKQYLEGKYGADPYLRKIIDWSVEGGKEIW